MSFPVDYHFCTDPHPFFTVIFLLLLTHLIPTTSQAATSHLPPTKRPRLDQLRLPWPPEYLQPASLWEG